MSWMSLDLKSPKSQDITIPLAKCVQELFSFMIRRLCMVSFLTKEEFHFVKSGLWSVFLFFLHSKYGHSHTNYSAENIVMSMSQCHFRYQTFKSNGFIGFCLRYSAPNFDTCFFIQDYSWSWSRREMEQYAFAFDRTSSLGTFRITREFSIITLVFQISCD